MDEVAESRMGRISHARVEGELSRVLAVSVPVQELVDAFRSDPPSLGGQRMGS